MEVGSLPAALLRKSSAPRPNARRARSLRAPNADGRGARSLCSAPSGTGESGLGRSGCALRRAAAKVRQAFDAVFGPKRARDPESRTRGAQTRSSGRQRASKAPASFEQPESGHRHQLRWSKSPREHRAEPGGNTERKQRTSRWSKALRLRVRRKRAEKPCLHGRTGSGKRAQQREGNGRGDAERLSRREKLRRV
jgi:hypothetical protein